MHCMQHKMTVKYILLSCLVWSVCEQQSRCVLCCCCCYCIRSNISIEMQLNQKPRKVQVATDWSWFCSTFMCSIVFGWMALYEWAECLSISRIAERASRQPMNNQNRNTVIKRSRHFTSGPRICSATLRRIESKQIYSNCSWHFNRTQKSILHRTHLCSEDSFLCGGKSKMKTNDETRKKGHVLICRWYPIKYRFAFDIESIGWFSVVGSIRMIFARKRRIWFVRTHL